jgi:hypothetical protein
MRRRLLLLALLATALCAAPAADAASSKKCRQLAGKQKVVAKSTDAIVVRRGSEPNLTLTYSYCLFVKPRLYKLPGQNGGDTEFYNDFTLQGRYLVYGHVNAEEASPINPGWIEMVDMKRRKRLFQYDAFPVGPQDEESTGVTDILVRQDGAVAWIGYRLDNPDVYSVQTALLGQQKPAEIEQGTDIGKTSLRTVPGNETAFSYTRAGVRKEAAFGGPTLTETP